LGGLLTIEEAQQAIVARARCLDAEAVPVDEAAGRVVAEEAAAAVDLPPFPSSAMDGFALRAADTPGRLPVVGRIAAGRPAARALDAGEAMAIATGGAVPDGADAVIPVEYVVEHDNQVETAEKVEPGANVRPRGGDVARGDVVVGDGVRLGPAQLGALAAAGVARVTSVRRPRAVVLATGTELRRPGEPLGPGEIYEANALLLAAALEDAGAAVERLPAVEDDEAAHRAALERGLEGDVLVTTGGVSVGVHDLVRRTLAELGVEEEFWGVAVKPGKPIAFGVRDRTLVFGLPGNPVSALVGFELFVRPALRGLLGQSPAVPPYRLGRLAAPARRIAARDQLLRARSSSGEDGSTTLEPLGGQESHMIVRAAGADALLLVPRGDGKLEAGETVRFLPLGRGSR
jgi:molybdopterin molybdotransferase